MRWRWLYGWLICFHYGVHGSERSRAVHSRIITERCLRCGRNGIGGWKVEEQ